jgi:hypothetical protein
VESVNEGKINHIEKKINEQINRDQIKSNLEDIQALNSEKM